MRRACTQHPIKPAFVKFVAIASLNSNLTNDRVVIRNVPLLVAVDVIENSDVGWHLTGVPTNHGRCWRFSHRVVYGRDKGHYACKQVGVYGSFLFGFVKHAY